MCGATAACMVPRHAGEHVLLYNIGQLFEPLPAMTGRGWSCRRSGGGTAGKARDKGPRPHRQKSENLGDLLESDSLQRATESTRKCAREAYVAMKTRTLVGQHSCPSSAAAIPPESSGLHKCCVALCD